MLSGFRPRYARKHRATVLNLINQGWNGQSAFGARPHYRALPSRPVNMKLAGVLQLPTHILQQGVSTLRELALLSGLYGMLCAPLY